MKNRFLLVGSLFIFVLLIFLIHPQSALAWSLTPNASTGDSVVLSLAISTSTASASTTITSTGADTTIGGVGFVVGTVSGTYTATSSRYDNSYATGTDLSWSITEAGTGAKASSTNVVLSPGTLYYYRAYATNTVVGVGYGGIDNEKTLLTKPDAPASTTLSISSASDRIKLTWTAGNGSEKTMVRYRTDNYPTSISDGDQAFWATGTEVTIYNLASERTLYFRVWSSTSDGGYTQQSDSFASVSGKTTAGAGGGGRTLKAPTTYADSLVINQGAVTTQAREVVLKLKATNAAYMSISNDNLFLVPLETYATTKSWTLSEGDGVKTVYVKFTSQDGLNSDVVSGTITLATPAPVIPTTPAEPAIPATPAIPAEEPATPAIPAIPATPTAPAKPISEMTKEELTAKIAEILAQVQALQAELTKLKEIVVFENNLKYGNRGDDVVKLQEVLIEEGVLSGGLNTGWFGPATKAAVIKFQEKYAFEILTPNGLTKGTGFVGSSTRDKLNELSGK